MIVATAVLLVTMHGTVPHTRHPQKHIVATHRHKRRYLRRLVFFSPIKGSRESLLRQNVRADEDQLERIQDDAQLEQLTREGSLVELPEASYVTVDPRLPETLRYTRAWTHDFVADFAQDFYTKFHKPLQVNSAVRTVEYQQILRKHNGNAAADSGELASPHLTGATIDIGKSGLSRKQLKWARDYLLQLQNSGVLDVEEEFRQRVFHITVYKSYSETKDASAAAQTTDN
jgi:uncharacterized protein YcbK (DUF882 family)